MEEKKKMTNLLKSGFMLCPGRHILILCCLLIIGTHILLRPNYELNCRMSERFVRPAHARLALFSSHVPFSLAEALIAAAVVFLLVYLSVQIGLLIRRPERAVRLYRCAITLLSAAAVFYSIFCALWGTFFYGDDFLKKSSFQEEKISVEQLKTVTEYFAELANEYSVLVPRADTGSYDGDVSEILSYSKGLYRNVTEEYPCLQGPEVAVKGIHFSKILSLLDFTGFFFPLTAEANVNIDAPVVYLPSTVAHELAHQRGVAQEQEANFVAVLACMEDGDPEYCYSAAILAYTHLGNALYKADYEAWKTVYESLNESVRNDLAENNRYWDRYRTPVKTVSNTVYEGFLQSYSQTLGLESYGACVDLLVNYYYPRMAEG